MRQEVKVAVVFTYDVDASLDRLQLEQAIINDFDRLIDRSLRHPRDFRQAEAVSFIIGQLKEEAEIYGNR